MTKTQKSKGSPFKTVSKQLAFYPVKDEGAQAPFVGRYVSALMLGEDREEEERIPCFIFQDIETEEEIFITQSWAIKKCVATAEKEFPGLEDIIFSFEFLGKAEVNGRPFNKFETGYCTEADYLAAYK